METILLLICLLHSRYQFITKTVLNLHIIKIIAVQGSVDIEELVDDFSAYYIAGKSIIVSTCLV